jgi:hypothetical protein
MNCERLSCMPAAAQVAIYGLMVGITSFVFVLWLVVGMYGWPWERKRPPWE